MKRAIITGATGAIGTALIAELVNNNIEVLVLCNRNSKRKDRIPKHPLILQRECSLNEMATMQNDTGKEYDVFYHFAWAGTTGPERNDMYLQNENVRFALDAINLAKRFGCKTFIGAGSQAEYGRYEGLLKPDTPVFPEMGYGMAKLCAGQMTRMEAKRLGMRHIWTRILSVYGPNDGPNSMVMSTIHKLQNGELPEFTKGEQIWDFLYNGDAAKAFLLLADRGIDGKTYILGSGNGKPLKEYIEIIRDVVSPGAELGIGKLPYSDKQVMYLCADITETKQDLDWTPQMTFREGIKKIMEEICYEG